MIHQTTLHLSVGWLELLRDLFLSIVQSQAVEEHDTWQHAFSDTVRYKRGYISAAQWPAALCTR